MALGLGIANELLETPTLWSPYNQGLANNLEFWYENNNDITTSAWLDQSKNNNDATQGTSLRQPDVFQGGLRFNGTSDYMDMDSKFTIAQGGPFAVFMVMKLASASNCVFLSDSASEFFEIMTTKKFRFKGSNGGALTTVMTFSDVQFNIGEVIILSVLRDPEGNFFLYKDGEQVVPDGGSSQNLNNDRGFDIFNLGVRNDNDRLFEGIIYEIFMYNKKLDDPQLDNAHEYLKSKFSAFADD
tara:strand:- start:8752 stop:9477 length:726 start_codon:yes stop_codon:yes gene_type:complete